MAETWYAVHVSGGIEPNHYGPYSSEQDAWCGALKEGRPRFDRDTVTTVRIENNKIVESYVRFPDPGDDLDLDVVVEEIEAVDEAAAKGELPLLIGEFQTLEGKSYLERKLKEQ